MKNLVLKSVLGVSALLLLASAASAGSLDDVK